MKKLTTLVLAAGLVVSSFAGVASAAEFKPFAQFAEEFIYGDEGKMLNNGSEDTSSHENFNAATRIRFGFDYIASEDLSATMLFQYRHTSWGANNKFTDDPEVYADGDHFRMRLAYIDWTIPSTDVKVRMGRQAVVAPSYAFGSAILDGRADAVTFNGAVNDNISLGFGWMRLASGGEYDGDQIIWGNSGFDAQDDADALMLNAEFAYDGFKVAPWAMYVSKQENAWAGVPYVEARENTSAAADAYVIGASAELNMFDPFVFAVDALYSNAKYHNVDPANEDSFDGFFVAAKASYKLSNGTAALGGWYASGADREEAKNDVAFVTLDGGFSASTILFGDNIIGADDYNTLTGDTPFGTWGLVAEYAGFSFLENLTHTARVVYVQGTNETYERDDDYSINFENLTEDDTLIEVDFNSTYQIYKNFSATLELGYVFVDQDLKAGAEEADDIFRSGLTFVYNF